jgi:hypothetical protein
MAQQLTVKEVRAMLDQHLRVRPDLGVWNAVTAQIMEPRNPFNQKSVRKPHRWFVIVLSGLFAAIVAFTYFNLWN